MVRIIAADVELDTGNDIECLRFRRRLGAAFPLGAAVGPVASGGEEGGGGVEECGERECGGPDPAVRTYFARVEYYPYWFGLCYFSENALDGGGWFTTNQ